VFVDDLNVHIENWEDHLRHLEAVLSKFREVNLKLNPGKCCFVAESIVFLGYVVSKEGAKPDPKKIDAVLRFPEPMTVTSVRSFLGLTRYYRKYVQGYSRLAGPLFELTKKDVVFIWNQDCQQAFDSLKRALVDAPILVHPDFKRPFCLDVDWSTKGVGAVLSQKEGRFEKVVAYASKGLTVAQRKFHPMEGECYALIWGIMHVRQYLHINHFTLRTDHKLLEWLATVSDAHGRRGKWIDMLQDFSFKILHRPGLKHTNVDALSRNLVGQAMDDDDFGGEIQDVGSPPTDMSKRERETLFVQTGKETKWLGVRRKDKQCVRQHACYDHVSKQQLYMVDMVSKEDQAKEFEPYEAEIARKSEIMQGEDVGAVLKRRRPQCYDRQQQLELVLAAQQLFESGECDLAAAGSDEEDEWGASTTHQDIWEDVAYMDLLQGGMLPDTIDHGESKRAKKRISNYHWQDQSLYFKDLLVPRPEDRMGLVVRMHKDLGHFGEEKTLTEVCRRYFWHNRTEDVKTVVKICQQCQMVRRVGSIRSEDEELKSIHVCDLFHRVAMDTTRPLPETKSRNKYTLVAIDHYSKWCKAKAIVDHGAKTAAKFLEDDIICRYGVPKFVLTDNGGEWAVEFDVMCKDYGI